MMSMLAGTDWILQLMLLAKVALAMLLGGLIGFERETARRPAGLRTHMMIAAAAALLIGLGDPLAQHFSAGHLGTAMRIDPTRLIGAVVTAVGFIGAGTIFRLRGEHIVVGLTTAASLLVTATIGIAVGLGQYLLAIGVTVLALLVLRVLRRLESVARDSSGKP